MPGRSTRRSPRSPANIATTIASDAGSIRRACASSARGTTAIPGCLMTGGSAGSTGAIRHSSSSVTMSDRLYHGWTSGGEPSGAASAGPDIPHDLLGRVVLLAHHRLMLGDVELD